MLFIAKRLLETTDETGIVIVVPCRFFFYGLAIFSLAPRHLKRRRSSSPSCSSAVNFVLLGRPDITVTVDWALKINYLSILSSWDYCLMVDLNHLYFGNGGRGRGVRGSCLIPPPSPHISLSLSLSFSLSLSCAVDGGYTPSINYTY